ncbi:MAG: hypothetical protein HOP36_11625 [Methyloglobulus sp.]|nr:hypothetical protein [Methyloglobulus sp.]
MNDKPLIPFVVSLPDYARNQLVQVSLKLRLLLLPWTSYLSTQIAHAYHARITRS